MSKLSIYIAKAYEWTTRKTFLEFQPGYKRQLQMYNEWEFHKMRDLNMKSYFLYNF